MPAHPTIFLDSRQIPLVPTRKTLQVASCTSAAVGGSAAVGRERCSLGRSVRPGARLSLPLRHR